MIWALAAAAPARRCSGLACEGTDSSIGRARSSIPRRPSGAWTGKQISQPRGQTPARFGRLSDLARGEASTAPFGWRSGLLMPGGTEWPSRRWWAPWPARSSSTVPAYTASHWTEYRCSRRGSLQRARHARCYCTVSTPMSQARKTSRPLHPCSRAQRLPAVHAAGMTR